MLSGSLDTPPLSGYPDSMIINEPLFDIEPTDDSLAGLTSAVAMQAREGLHPEAVVMRYLLTHVRDLNTDRSVRADDSDVIGREVQFLTDLRTAVEEALGNSIRSANSHGATWQRLGDLLGVSRQSAHERYAI